MFQPRLIYLGLNPPKIFSVAVSSLGVAVMDGKIWGYGAGEARPIPPISSPFRRFPKNLAVLFYGTRQTAYNYRVFTYIWRRFHER